MHAVQLAGLLSSSQWSHLLFTTCAVYAPWFRTTYPTWPLEFSMWFWRIFWFLVYGGVIAAYTQVQYYYTADKIHLVANSVEDSGTYFLFLQILLYAFIFHLKFLEMVSVARYLTLEYWVSNVIFVLTIIASGALSVLCGVGHMWLACVGFGVICAALIGFLVNFLLSNDAAAYKLYLTRGQSSNTKLKADDDANKGGKRVY